ncbi:MAG TPA: anti-sigma factor [Thermoleophilaceae bacterium]|nr:anti-sigma factor [Thermoleophilaceae bacterium]
MTTDTHSRFEGDLAAYLLGALGDSERRDFERHLDGCPRCQEDHRRLQVSVKALGEAVPQLDPPASLGRALRRRARAERRGGAAARLRPVLRPAAGMAATAAVAVGVAVLVTDGGESSRATTVAAVATPAAPRAEAKLVVHEASAELIVESLPPPKPGRVYQVWIRHGKRIVPSTLFTVDRNGRGAAAIPGGLGAGADEVMVSEEPVRGSTVPTTPPRLRVALS